MKFNSQICTTKEQSERLLALGLKKETADMSIRTDLGFPLTTPYKEVDMFFHVVVIPTWSLHRLIEMIPITIPDKSGITHDFTIEVASDISYCYFGDESWETWKSWHKKELYDNIIDCIEWLIKEGYFNKEYLEE